MAVIWNKNEREARRLLKSGRTSMRELLTLSFGEWPLKGLDIDVAVPHAQKIDLKLNYSDLWNFYGRAQALDKKERWIEIDKRRCISRPLLIAKSFLASTMGHEALHILQGDNYYRADDIYGRKEAEKIRRSQKDAACRLAMDELKLCPDFFRAAHSKSFFLEHLTKGEETQAYLHEALAAGYKKWRKMPRDKDELWSALISLGLMPPMDIRRHMNSLPAGAPAYDFMKRVHYKTQARLRTINNSLSEAGREYFWRTTLPALYADLIEMYGDRQGRERFGLGPNIKGQIQEAAFGTGRQSPAAAESSPIRALTHY